MKSIEKVLLAIRLECGKKTKLAGEACFEKVARRAEILPESLPAYLAELQKRGFVKYSIKEHYICLTEEGTRYIE